MLTVSTSSPSLAISDLSGNQAMEVYLVRLYTRSVDAILGADGQFQRVLKKLLLEQLPFTGISLSITHVVGGKGTYPGPSLSSSGSSLVDWRKTDDLTPGTVNRRESGTEIVGKDRDAVTMEELMRQAEQTLVASVGKTTPDYQQIFLHWLWLGQLGIVVGLFRVKNSSTTLEGFTHSERALLDTLAPYLARLLRLSVVLKSGQSGYEFFSRRTFKIVEEFGLTATEYRILHKLMAGVDNVSIAKEIGVSVATVKTHITHILQKTGCRNRNALLAHYFSSVNPFRVRSS